MKSYMRPVVLVHQEMAEGVYAASGSATVDFYIENNKLVLVNVPAGQKVTITFADGSTKTTTYQCGGIYLGCGNKNVTSVVIVEEEKEDQCGGSNGGWRPGHWWWW